MLKWLNLMGRRTRWKQDDPAAQECQLDSCCRLQCSDPKAPRTTPYPGSWIPVN